MNRLGLFLGGIALAILPASSALADTFNFSFSGSDFSAAGTFDATAIGGGVFQANSMTGQVLVGSSLYAITGLDSVDGFLDNDNLYYTGASKTQTGGFPFDFLGFAFSLSDGSSVTLFSEALPDSEGGGVGTAEILGPPLGYATDYAGISTAPGVGSNNVTPEPASLMLLGTGILGMAGLVRRRLSA